MSSWVALDVGVERNRKLLDLRARLGWSANDALARFTRLLLTLREQEPSGDLGGWSAQQIATAMEPAGGLDADALVGALVAAGLLVELDGGLTVKGWVERNGSYLRQTVRERQRVAAGKLRAAAGRRDERGRYCSSVGPRPPSDGTSAATWPAPAVTSDSPATVTSDSPATVTSLQRAVQRNPLQEPPPTSTPPAPLQRVQLTGAVQEQEQEQEKEARHAAASSPSLRSVEDLARSARPAGSKETPDPKPDTPLLPAKVAAPRGDCTGSPSCCCEACWDSLLTRTAPGGAP